MSTTRAGTEKDEKVKERAEAFVCTLHSEELQKWYRSQLALLPRRLRAAKARVLQELAAVLDTVALESLQSFLAQCWEQHQQQDQKQDQQQDQQQDRQRQKQKRLHLGHHRQWSPLLCLLVAPPSLDKNTLAAMQDRAGLAPRQPSPTTAYEVGARY